MSNSLFGGGGSDPTAVHTDLASEISGVAEKVTPVGADVLLIEDSAAGNVKKKVQITNLPGGGGGGQTDTVTGSNGITNVGTNVDADLAPTYGAAANTVCQGNDARLSDARTPTSHGLGGSEHATATLAQLNAKVSDATLIDTGDSRLSDERTADAIATTGADVSTSGAAPPSTGQVLQATSATTATWQTPAGSVDTTAIHKATSAEISAMTAKTTPVGGDWLVIEDSAAGNAKKKVSIDELPRYQTFQKVLAGKVPGTVITMDGPWVAPYAGEILRVTFWRGVAGSSGTTTMDVSIEGTTVFTTQSNRPAIAQTDGDDYVDVSGTIQAGTFSQDDKITVDLDAFEAGNPKNLAVTIHVRLDP